jgi:hypothetical protein
MVVMKKLTSFLWLFLVALCAFACSAGPVEDVSEQQEALNPSCSIVGIAGVSHSTYITAVRLVDSVGAKLDIDYLNPTTNVRDTQRITFKDVHFYSYYTVNGTEWTAQNDDRPLRRVTFRGPGWLSQYPDSYSLALEGDLDFGDHVNEFQNFQIFLVDRQVIPNDAAPGYPWTGEFEAPPGYGISRFEGTGTTPTNTLKVYARTPSGVIAQNFKFETSGCPFP